MGVIKVLMTDLMGRFGLPDSDRGDEVITIEEMRALAGYALDHGVDSDPPAAAELAQRVNKYEIKNNDQNLDSKHNEEEIILYQRLCDVTYENHKVNGHTIIDSGSVIRKVVMNQVGFWLVAFLLAGVAPEVFDELPDTSLGYAVVNGLNKMQSFVWGAFGAGVFLTMYLSEKASKFQFDSRRLQGIFTRYMLGGAVGFSTVNLLNGQSYIDNVTLGETILENPTPAGIAFLSGLGVRVVYGLYMVVLDRVYYSLVGQERKAGESA